MSAAQVQSPPKATKLQRRMTRISEFTDIFRSKDSKPKHVPTSESPKVDEHKTERPSSLLVRAPETFRSATEAKFLPGSNRVNVAHNVTSSEFVYYRVYHKVDAIATKRPAYLNDSYIGWIRSKWVTPPHTAGSLKHRLCFMENIDPNQTKLFASVSNQSAFAEEAPISLTSNQTLGIIPEDPVILFSEVMPQAEMQPGTESFRVAPDSESPVAPRFLFYGVYTETGAQASRAPIDAEHPWVSKIDLYSILPPVSAALLLHILNMKEGINTSPQLLAQDGLTPLGDDQIFTKDGNWLGASADDHLVLKFGRPPFERSPYRIKNRCTGNSLQISSTSVGHGVHHLALVSSAGPSSCCDRVLRKDFTLALQDDGRVAFYGGWPGHIWIGPHWGVSETEHPCWLIPSTTNKNYFFICPGDLVSRKVFIEAGRYVGVTDWDTTDTRQMWSLIPADEPEETDEQSCCLVV